MTRSAIVVGAGVSGLTTATLLQENGWSIRLWAREVGLRSSSSIAPALFYPYLAQPRHKVAEWAKRSYSIFDALSRIADSGVSTLAGLEHFSSSTEKPWWADVVGEWSRVPSEDAWRFRTLLIRPENYFPYLVQRFIDSGGSIEQRSIVDLDEAFEKSVVVILCTGLDSRDLVDDPELMANRGQLLRVTNPGLSEFRLDLESHDQPTYIIPRGDDIVLGGTSSIVEEQNSTPDTAICRAIRDRCETLEPRLRNSQLLEERVGFRPHRTSVRVEVENVRPGKWCIYNYGHSGSGFTLSWGCAEEVRGLAETVVRSM